MTSHSLEGGGNVFLGSLKLARLIAESEIWGRTGVWGVNIKNV